MGCSIDICYDDATMCALDDQQIERVCSEVLAKEGIARPCFISVTIASDDRMRELNEEWREQNRATDVLSIECERPDDPDLADNEPCELGDIVLAPDYIARQAHSFGTTPVQETTLLLVHAVLHLLGYDHMDEDEAIVMEAREDELVSTVLGSDALRGTIITRHHNEVAQ